MLRLLDFLYQNRITGLFIVLQVVCVWLIASYNYRYNTYFLNSSNRLAGEVASTIGGIYAYFDLQNINQELAEENLALRQLLANQSRQPLAPVISDSAGYSLTLARVVNTSYLRSRNYITLRIQPQDSIRPGMGVISPEGVLGRVKSVSNHFATVTSLLHPGLMVSGRVKATGALCTIQWEGESPREAELKYLPRHLPLSLGDTVLTSGMGGVFPEGMPIGVVSRTDLPVESPFYVSKVRLFTDFTRLHTAYIVKIPFKEEMDKLEEELPNE